MSSASNEPWAQAAAAPATQGVSLTWRGAVVEVEYQWISPELTAAPLLVFLHEGLGSVAMWKDFPRQLCEAGGFRGLVYSRPGYGRSTPRAAQERWGVDFMHRQAHEVLPLLLKTLGVVEAPWLFGHSDGASIALLHAAAQPDAVQGVVVLAPHVFVEDLTVQSIVQARQAYESTDLPSRLARYHNDPDSAFWGWCGVWLDPAFRRWDIVRELAPLASAGVPILAVQGENDEYGTLAQIDAIARHVATTEIQVLPQCGHSPHRDQCDAVIAATVAFFQRPRVAPGPC